MPTYHVSVQNGSDANDGLTPATALATLGAVAAIAVAGDTIHVGPGTYRERVAPANSGAAGNLIQWLADQNAEILTSDHPDICRITGCDASELPTAGSVIELRPGGIFLEYHRFVGFHVDGCIGDYCVNSEARQTNYFEDCHIIGEDASIGGTMTRVTAMGAREGFNGAVLDACVCFVAGSGAKLSDSTNSIFIGRDGGVHLAASSRNDIFLGCVYGSKSSTSVINGLAAGCQYGYLHDGANVFHHNLAYACDIPFNGSNAGAALDLSTSFTSYCRSTPAGTVTGAATPVGHVDMSWLRSLMLLQPAITAGLFRLGDFTSAPDHDLLGRLRSVATDIGPWQSVGRRNPDLDWADFATVPPGIVLTRAGEYPFRTVVTSGQSLSFTCQAKSVVAGQAKLKVGRWNPDGTFTELDSAVTAGAGAFEQLQVSIVGSADELLEVRLQNLDDANPAVFSDVS